MKPAKRDSNDYEKVKTDDFVVGMIEDVAYDQEHKFSFKGEEKVRPAVRFKFALDGCSYPHYSRWQSFNYGEKSVLYLKYLSALVDGAAPDMDFDLDQLKGMRVKTLWTEKNNFQSVETVRPANGKVIPVVNDVGTGRDIAKAALKGAAAQSLPEGEPPAEDTGTEEVEPAPF